MAVSTRGNGPMGTGRDREPLMIALAKLSIKGTGMRGGKVARGFSKRMTMSFILGISSIPSKMGLAKKFSPMGISILGGIKMDISMG